MRKIFVLSITILLLGPSAQAELINNHDGTITQVKSDGGRLMWMQDANYAQTSGFDPDGQIPWDTAINWASAVSFSGHTGWRLPLAFENWAGCGGYSDKSEMGDLYYNELGNSAGSYVNAGPFFNMGNYWYWTGTLFEVPTTAMVFMFWDADNIPPNLSGWQSNGDRYDVNGTWVWLVRDVPANAAPNTFFAHVADGGGQVTTFTISNPTTGTATGNLILRGDDGAPWTLTLDGTSASEFSFSIPAMGSLRLVSSGASKGTKTGWAALNSESAIQGVATYDFLKKKSALLAESAEVASTISGSQFALPVDISASSDVGFAVANVGLADASVRIVMKGEDGSTADAVIPPQLTALAVEEHVWIMAGELFSNLKTGSFKGLMLIEVVGEGDIAVMAVAYKQGHMSGIPIVRLAE